ncbi:Mor transcription activator family protein [Hylemonella sp. W303a]|uniref:Mor transcription activator family protein n=1 Tax=Hylemonella sp. W303a TaxID=3389873 RepID=UPI00396B2573
MIAITEVEVKLLPPLLQDFVRLIGIPATMLLVQNYGGRRIYIPSPERCTEKHAISQLIGPGNLSKLADCYGSMPHFQFPKAERALLAVRNARIVNDYRTKTARELAMQHNLTEGQIVRILSQAGAHPPASRRQNQPS